jgi:hypothetical protein
MSFQFETVTVLAKLSGQHEVPLRPFIQGVRYIQTPVPGKPF